jgi:hypothetical protein
MYVCFLVGFCIQALRLNVDMLFHPHIHAVWPIQLICFNSVTFIIYESPYCVIFSTLCYFRKYQEDDTGFVHII